MRTSRTKSPGTNLHRNRMAIAACFVTTASFLASSCADADLGGNDGSGENPDRDPSPSAEWTYYGGQNSFNRYSPLTQISAENVASLEIAWQRPGVDANLQDEFPELAFNNYLRGTPILVDGTLYAPNAVGLVEAFDPGTGKTRWVQQAASLEDARGRSFRGVAHWSGDGAEDLTSDNGHAGGRIISVRGSWLHALDAGTGRPVASFGDGGSVNLVPEGRDRFNWSSGPIVVGDIIVIAGTVDGAGDSGTEWRDSEPEDIRGYDARTGELAWTFHVIPREGEFGADTWGDGSRELSGDVGSWCCLSADDELGIVYVPLGAPTSAYYGGHRPGDNLFANSLVALDAATGERLWHFQMVHHDIWEYDTLGPPVLGRIDVDGRAIDAVMQASKTGFLFTFDRRTGEPVWPIEERAVPQSKVPGEATSPTQPFPSKPPPFDRQGVSEKDLIDFTPEIHKRALALADSLVLGPLFTPPMEEGSIEGKIGTYVVPGAWGAGNWHTGAFDPETATYYAVSLTLPNVWRLSRTDEPGDMEFGTQGGWPRAEIEGLPIVRPPWGRITAIDMNRGEHLWMAPNGDAPNDHPLLEGLDLPPLGNANRPAPLLTATLLFIGEGSDAVIGTPDTHWGTEFRAYDKATGKVVWEMDLPSGTTGGPMTYMHEGKQYIVVAVGGSESPAEYVALALP
ncbi:MAG: PQQ-binding-like beta-propeller repeat protein [Gammaproteobacteria bacterium]|nr:PQQ-binding-like beta-propeller repeat protein [Gammaproteobacteria bacterium]MYF62064.1 PQQ-binding-like beta-propeller repeat protein [Gammaproteobacteria bacterium]MYI22535.1 PQQ-binding-like beta-propeller repeat protein [Gammaproteobacteria bacterium]